MELLSLYHKIDSTLSTANKPKKGATSLFILGYPVSNLVQGRIHDVYLVSGLYYINGYGHEVYPKPNPEFIKNLSNSEVLVYSCGSLWTR